MNLRRENKFKQEVKKKEKRGSTGGVFGVVESAYGGCKHVEWRGRVPCNDMVVICKVLRKRLKKENKRGEEEKGWW
jgi:hypothetical protein